MIDKKVVAVIFVNNENKALLYLRDDKPSISYPNHWALIGGHSEENESLLFTLKREVMEEIEYDIKEQEFLGIIEDDNVGNTVYVYKSKINLPLNKIPLNEGQKLGYFNFNEIMNLKLPPPLREFILKNESRIFSNM
jgi:8-oxo-dGTP diphosphatase